MKWPKDYVIVKVPSVFINEVALKGLDAKALYMEVTYRPAEHVRTYGIVVSVPSELSGEPLYSRATGIPSYESTSGFEFVRMSEINLEVQEGDKIYFHYSCLLPNLELGIYNKNFLYSEMERHDGKNYLMLYFRIYYRLIFAAIRYKRLNNTMLEFDWKMEGKMKATGNVGSAQEGFGYVQRQLCVLDEYNSYFKEVQMIGSYVLVEPDKETWKDISIPLPVVINGLPVLDKNGLPMMRPESEWLLTKAHPELAYLRGWIRHIGSPLKGFDRTLSVGKYVYFRYYTNTELAFEGEVFFRMIQHYIGMWEPSKTREHDEIGATEVASS